MPDAFVFIPQKNLERRYGCHYVINAEKSKDFATLRNENPRRKWEPG